MKMLSQRNQTNQNALVENPKSEKLQFDKKFENYKKKVLIDF